jgi:hypothetical protein
VTISLNDWTKFYEAITKPLPIASSLFLLGATSFLLFGSPSILDKLGLSHAVTEYRWLVGLGFIIAATWIVVTAIIGIVKRCYLAWSTYQAERKQQQRLHALTADERRILSGYVADEVRNKIFHNAPDLGAAQGLADDGILYRPNVMRDEKVAVPYNIQEWALAYLSKNKGLIASLVSAETRWSRTGRWQAAVRAVGKLVLAIILAYAGLMLASLAGGFLAGMIGAIFHLSRETIASLEWTFPKIVFLGILVWLYSWDKRRKATRL